MRLTIGNQPPLGCVTKAAYRNLLPTAGKDITLDSNFRHAGLFLAVFVFGLPLTTRVLADAPGSSAHSVSTETGEQLAVLAGGCFWCTEAVFERMEGVNDVVSGYIGGHVENPTYQQVCGKKTGHAEAVQVYFDPTKTSFEELLEVFFKVHDPTTLNRQGEDSGPQYRSSIFYQDDAQKQIAENYIKKLDESGEFRRPVVTLLEPSAKFYVAEEYHQDYFRRNPNANYCKYVVYNKVRKFNRTFGDKIKKELK